MTELAALCFFVLCGAGLVASLIAPERWGSKVVAFFGLLAALAALFLGAIGLYDGGPPQITLWRVMSLGAMVLRIDRLSALFVLVTGLVFLPVSLYSATYLRKFQGLYSLKYFGVLYFVLFASIILTPLAGDIISFLVGWEVMSITSYLLVAYEDDHDDSAHAAFVMLAMSEAGMIAITLAFVLIASAAGTTDFGRLQALHRALPGALGWAVFLLSFGGFAVKAGLAPVNSWLPLAHPAAPTNVSALLSTVIVNLGLYGIIRTNLDIAPVHGVGPGLIVLVVGAVSALIGILYATTQAEMKRLLAHSTIENMGIVTAGLGAAMVFLTSGHQIAAGIALIAAFYHLTNHAAYKALLFVGTGAVEAGAGSRDLDRLGGLAQRMPWISVLFLVGVLSIAALPPLNGFVSEWLTLQSILRSAILASNGVKIVFAVSGVLLALTAGLAVTCFVKVFAMGFLGLPRSAGAEAAHERETGARTPLVLLAIACISLGILPTYVIPALDRAVAPLTHQSATQALVPPFFDAQAQRREGLPEDFLADFHNLGADTGAAVLPGRGLVVLHRGGKANPVVFAMSTFDMLLALALILALTVFAFRLASRGRTMSRAPPWAGGLRRLVPEITYTATGFSNPVRVIFQSILRPVTEEDSTEAVASHFRTAIRRNQVEVPIFDRLILGPPVRALRYAANIVRKLHVGHVNAYAAYVLATLLVVLIAGAVLH